MKKLEMDTKRDLERFEFALIGMAVVAVFAGITGFVLGRWLG